MKNILYIDDEPFFIDIYKEILEQLNCRVTIINTVEKTEKELKENFQNYDLIILDMMIYATDEDKIKDWRKSGIYLFEYIITNYGKSTPILFITVNQRIEIMEEVRNIAFKNSFYKYTYLIKPVKIEKLISTISKFLNINKGDL